MIEELTLAKCLVDAFPLWLRDPSVSFEERSEAFHKFYTFLDYKSYVDEGFIDLTECDVSLYDDAYVDRYERVDYLVLLETLSQKLNLSDEVVEKMTEYVVTSGYRGFVYDW